MPKQNETGLAKMKCDCHFSARSTLNSLLQSLAGPNCLESNKTTMDLP